LSNKAARSASSDKATRRTSLIERFRDSPIERKLFIVTVLVTAVAMLLAGAAIFVSDAILFHRNLDIDLNALSQIVADDSTAALTFNDPQTASEILHALQARPHLISACLYRPDGTLLARYLRPGAQSCPPPDAVTRNPWFGKTITVSRTVLLDGRPVGKLTLLSDTGAVYQRMRVYGAVIFIALLIAGFVASAVSSRLRELIARPILELAHASSKIAKTRDYGIRARKVSQDELGVLVDAFNQMLSGIQARDIELRSTLEQLQQSNENLARSNEDLERFAFIASHDLQEPLRMMAVFSQLLSRRYSGALQEEGLRYLENIIEGAKRMRDLLSDLLEYTQLSATMADPPEQVDLNLVVRKVLENLQASIDQSGAAIVSDPLPTISAYEAHMVPLFQNLIGNAIKYRSADPPRIHIGFTEVHGEYRFEVADNGMGIAPEYHAKIFVAFKRLHGKEISGTGIGLAICQRVTERYGGSIWVESELGKGSRFMFTLPGKTG
jgi:signal transduction histidine kinase